MPGDQSSRVWDIIQDVHICMFVTHGPDGLRSRPLDARPAPEEDAIYFLTDIRGTKSDEIERNSNVCLVFIDEKAKAYLSVTGQASVLNDKTLAKKYWKKADEVWWPEKENDPNLRVLRIAPEYAELWDGPADPKVAEREFAYARATGEKPNLGEKRKVVVSMRGG
jgi:general stress protein 26